jgi:hypothetical protein
MTDTNSGTVVPVSFPLSLVSCVGLKLDRPAPARDLYISPWFRKVRRVVEKGPWFILSAKHGLVTPEKVIEPYNVTLADMPISERRAWASRVTEAIAVTGYAASVQVFAGARYREFLMSFLCGRFSIVTVPMQGLKIGKQLQWLDARI